MKTSIITACKNSSLYIERAIKSVLAQTYKDIQYIIVDGVSTDSTLDIINNYRDQIDTIISEPDTGIYNAMNKALKFVKGDIVHFLNSDDCFYDNEVLSDVMPEFINTKYDNMIVYGNVVINIDGNQNVLKYDSINERYFYKNTICHQAIFFKQKLFSKVGSFNEKYLIHADVDWLMRAYFRHRIKFKYINRIICHYSSGGFSSNPIYAERYKYDRQEISAKYFLEAKIKLKIKKFLKKLV